VIPPIGAQGLNLGLRDAATLADCISDALQEGCDIGGPEMLKAYTRARSFDISTRTWSIDILNRSLISGLLPVQLIRGLGLHALKAIGPLRRLAIREGLAPSFGLPALMRFERETTTHPS
jgi:2-octaprenyl-6-methoxyphenol hydroxylase